ncbi:MAG: thermonuclease family protein [Hyphomonadaceae bacterium]
MSPLTPLIALLALLLAGCGPQIGQLERGETGRVARVFNGDTLILDDGLRVFLAEVDAPRGEQAYARQAQAELEALALHRNVLLAYGGAKRWVGRPRDDGSEPMQAALAHVFVQSEGGRWLWLQHALVARGAAFVRPRADNHARAGELLQLEAQARAAERGLWGQRSYRALTVAAAARAASAYADNCMRGDAPYRLLEGRVSNVFVGERRAALDFELRDDQRFSAVLFGDGFAAWDGPPLEEFNGANVRLRGALGVYRDQPQLCFDHSSQIELLR